MNPLQLSYTFKIRFREIDAMRVVWHGAYAKYFEDAREAFGQAYGLDYQMIEDNGYYAPIVDLTFHYRKPIRYGMTPVMTIVYRPSEAAKIIFDYEIRESNDGDLMASAQSVQVFMDLDYNLVLLTPPFYEQWKKNHTEI